MEGSEAEKECEYSKPPMPKSKKAVCHAVKSHQKGACISCGVCVLCDPLRSCQTKGNHKYWESAADREDDAVAGTFEYHECVWNQLRLSHNYYSLNS